MRAGDVAAIAAATVESVGDSTEGRYRVASEFYDGRAATNERSRYRVAELRFLRWEIERGVLNQPTAERPGSPCIGFIPWAPIAMGELAVSSNALASAAARHRATPAQIALAWLLQRSPVVLPIPGSGSLEHLRENVSAALIELSENDLLALERAPRPPS